MKRDKTALTKKEQLIFNHLEMHRGEAISRGDLYYLLRPYDENEVPCSNVVDVHIKNLRRKLPIHENIKAIRLFGYMLV